MKAHLIRVLAAACLVATPFLPAMAGTATDEDLGVVGARGFNQLGAISPADAGPPYQYRVSVQIEGSAQMGAQGMLLEDTAASASNVGQNVASGGTVNAGTQVNEQRASNEKEVYAGYGTERTNYSVVRLAGSAESLSQTMAILNAAGSAANIGQNMLSATATGRAVFQQVNEQRAIESFNIDYVYPGGQGTYPIIPNRKIGTVQATGSAQSGASSMAIVNAAISAVNIGQNIASLGGMGSMPYIRQVNAQEARHKSSMMETGAADAAVKSVASAIIAQQISTPGMTNAQGPQSGVAAVLLANLADASVNVGGNILSVGNVLGFNATQLNRQAAWNAFEGLEDYYFVFYGANNNNAAVQVRGDAQVGSNGVALINAAVSAMNLGQNVASADAGGIIGQQNRQDAINNDYWASSWPIISEGLIENNTLVQRNNSNSVQVLEGQADSSFMAFTNAASAAINVGQNTASTGPAAQPAKTGQDNRQYAGNIAYAQQYLDNMLDDPVKNLSLRQDNNLGSIQMKDGAQDGSSGLELDNTVVSALNIGQNVAYLASSGMSAAYQANSQKASASGDLSQAIDNGLAARLAQDNNNGSLQIFDSMDSVNGFSVSSLAGAAANVGQNVASVNDAMGTGMVTQLNSQKAKSSMSAEQDVHNAAYTTMSQENNNGSVRFDNSGNYVSAGSFLSAALSAANVGQNIATVDAKEAAVKQINEQRVYTTASGAQTVRNYGEAEGQTNNNVSVELAGSQNGVQALSVANLAGSAANIGQNIANVDAYSGANVMQANKQEAKARPYAAQTVATDVGASRVTGNNGSVYLDGSQNGLSALAVVNAALSAVNVGQNIASVTGNDISVHQVNCQEAKTDALESQTVGSKGSVASQSNSSSLVIDSSQMNASAMFIANVSNSAVNYGQNIISISGARGGSLYQTNLQKAW
jgi:uncharacterized protein YsxB (DUF464 family)